jgi:outer membrane protein OmpA-like peptidoglycan-associated protein
VTRLLPLLALVACTLPQDVQRALSETEGVILAAHKVHAPLCAPEELANAESAVDFTKLELESGDIRRAGEDVTFAAAMAAAALEKATPCGGTDRDRDTIADIVDDCPDEPEDLDGDRDEDGCRDVDPYGDEDHDGLKNAEDSCVFEPEDFDGDNDADGCPEVSGDADGDGRVDAADKCVNEPEDKDGYLDTDGCPDPDNDEDGVLDFRDMCAFVAEDLDAWFDEDGCPDADNDLDGMPDLTDQCPNQPGDRFRNGCPAADGDGDGVADDVDRCPTEKETVNQYLDEDGCPDVPPDLVRVTHTQVEIKEIIQFGTGSAQLLPGSSRVLDQIVKVLTDAPDMKLRIEGHTDNEGGDDANMQLSRERALAVRKYLESKGVQSNRLESVGFGETKPIDTNRTLEGRARNRRVEFHIVEAK